MIVAPMTTLDTLYACYLKHPCVSTDSRNTPVGSIFFALKGTSFNGNRYASMALEAGCSLRVPIPVFCGVQSDP